MAERKRAKREKPADPRPYIGDVGRKAQGPLDVVTVTSGMVLLALAAGFAAGFAVFLVMNLSTWLTELVWGAYLDGIVWMGLAAVIGSVLPLPKALVAAGSEADDALE